MVCTALQYKDEPQRRYGDRLLRRMVTADDVLGMASGRRYVIIRFSC